MAVELGSRHLDPLHHMAGRDPPRRAATIRGLAVRGLDKPGRPAQGAERALDPLCAAHPIVSATTTDLTVITARAGHLASRHILGA